MVFIDKDMQKAFAKREKIADDDEAEESVAKVTLSFLESTTAHGLSRVAREKTIVRRIFWCLIFLVAFGYFIYHFSDGYMMYKSYPVGVRTGVTRRNVFTFPAVTVCNTNMLKRSLLNGTEYWSLVKADMKAASDLDELLERLRNDSTSQVSRKRRSVELHEDDYVSYDYSSDLDEDAECHLANQKLCGLTSANFDKAVEMSATSDMSDLNGLLMPSWDDLMDYGYTAEEFIGQCSFDNKPCWPSNFSLIRSSEYGNCYVFNSAIHGQKVIRRTKKAGLRYGLRLTLVASQSDFVGLLAHERGVRVTVHSPWVHPFPTDNAVSAGSGIKTQIGARLYKDYRLPSPYPSQCTDGEGIKLDYPGNYTVLACESTCKRQHIKDACSCLPNAIKANDTILCTTPVDVKCMTDILRALDNGTLECNCPPACTVTEYHLSVSTTPWPSSDYSYYIQHQGLEEGWLDPAKLDWSLDQNLVRIHIFVDDTDIVTITEYPAYSWESLLADTGGFLGLFIGVSICTVIELFEFLIDLALFLIARQRQKKQTKVTSTPVVPWSTQKGIK